MAMPDEKWGHFYVGFGELFNPMSYRIGHKTWELGMVNNGAFALNKLFYKGNVYATFGPAITTGGVGFYGGMGYERRFWGIFSFRAEMNGAQSFSNYGTGGFLVGFTLTL
jgi:hypothetical protein